MATIFHIGGTRNGTGFGQVTSGTTANKMNNINYNSYFHDDVKLPGQCDQQTTSWETFTSGSTTIQFSKIGSHVYANFHIVGATGTICSIPQKYWPAKGVRFYTRDNASGNGTLLHFIVDVNGELRRQWGANAANVNEGTTISNVTASKTSYDFELDYWGVPD